MSTTVQQRQKIVEEVIGNARLEGLYPSELDQQLLDAFIKGEMTAEDMIKFLHQHYQDLPRVKMA